jgi:hypothetical protein
MTVFLVLQKPFSKYSDVRGHGYEYPTSIPNGRNIEEGDYLVCCLTKKNATDGQRVFGVGRIGFIRHYEKDGREHAFAEYVVYRELTPPLTFEEIGGDPRNNKTNAINRLGHERGDSVLEALLFAG